LSGSPAWFNSVCDGGKDRCKINLHAIDPVKLARAGSHSILVRLFIIGLSLVLALVRSNPPIRVSSFFDRTLGQLETCRIRELTSCFSCGLLMPKLPLLPGCLSRQVAFGGNSLMPASLLLTYEYVMPHDVDNNAVEQDN